MAQEEDEHEQQMVQLFVCLLASPSTNCVTLNKPINSSEFLCKYGRKNPWPLVAWKIKQALCARRPQVCLHVIGVYYTLLSFISPPTTNLKTNGGKKIQLSCFAPEHRANRFFPVLWGWWQSELLRWQNQNTSSLALSCDTCPEQEDREGSATECGHMLETSVEIIEKFWGCRLERYLDT